MSLYKRRILILIALVVAASSYEMSYANNVQQNNSATVEISQESLFNIFLEYRKQALLFPKGDVFKYFSDEDIKYSLKSILSSTYDCARLSAIRAEKATILWGGFITSIYEVHITKIDSDHYWLSLMVTTSFKPKGKPHQYRITYERSDNQWLMHQFEFNSIVTTTVKKPIVEFHEYLKGDSYYQPQFCTSDKPAQFGSN